jgi:hypothetical protein
LRAAVAVALLLAAGCIAALVESDLARRSFTHAAHIKRDLSCTDCHEGAEKEARAGMPGPEKCNDCHDPKEGAKDPGRPVIDAYAARLPEARYLRPASYADVRFDHSKHVAKKLDCARCHEGAATGPIATPAGPMRMDRCLGCHREIKGERPGSSPPLNCAACHEKLKTSIPPTSHDGDWTRRHGPIARMGPSERTAERCDLCHTRSSCAQCHAATRPGDHTTNFTIAGHGLRASMDRDRCLACHRTDSCERCHENEPPRSHVAGFGAPRDGHCTSCHFPLGDQGCVACHKATPSHLTAPPRPAGGVHATAASPGECLLCHRRLPHVDGGFDCKACHR